MEIVSSNYGCYFDELQRTYPPEFHGYKGYTETHMQLADEVSQGIFSEICFHGVRIHYGQFQTLKTDTIRTTEDFSSVEMMFQLHGQRSQQSLIQAGFTSKQHNLSYRPYADVRSRFEAGHHQYVGIQLTETFFGRFADADSPLLRRIGRSIVQRKDIVLVKQNLPITPILQAQLLQLTQPACSQSLKRLYLETAVLNILYQQLQQAETTTKRPATLQPGDVEKVLAIRDLLTTNPLASYSLLQLSRYVGLNDYKLKKGFRELTGTTVFGYLNDQRMKYAHQLLHDTRLSIGEIANTLGYSETHHFSAAFKRKFGYLPSQMNRPLISAGNLYF
jgi:AraC-like DNA-binding protein